MASPQRMSPMRLLNVLGGYCLSMMVMRVRKATAYLDTNLTVKVTFVGKPDRRQRKAGEFRLTVGRPNYAERKFIKQCIAAGETFPLKKVQLRHQPAKKKK